MSSSEFLGRSKKSVQDLAERHGMVFRFIRVDSEDSFDYPNEYRKDRICVEIDAGRVTEASI